MSSKSLLLVFAVLATLAVVAQCDDIVFGERQPGDTLVKETRVQKSRVAGQRTVTTNTYVPENGKKITAIELVDHNGDKSAAHAKILGGGPGHAFVAIIYESEQFFDVDFEVKYYAK